MLTSDQKGGIAETAVIHEAVKLGIGVLKPVNDGLRYELEDVAGRMHMHLRLAPAKNKQGAGITWAKDYEFGARLRSHGAVAQLGERRAGSA